MEDGLPVEDATPGNLWARLLAGWVTEVCVLSYRGLSHDLPQTLGLEVIAADAYVYGRYGVVRTHAERVQVARALAAEPRWLAIGGLPYWVEPFARRAEVILIVPSVINQLAPVRSSASYTRLPQDIEAMFEMRDEQELPADDTAMSGHEYMFDASMSSELAGVYFVRMQRFLLREFPEKSFAVGGDQLKQLRAVRARR